MRGAAAGGSGIKVVPAGGAAPGEEEAGTDEEVKSG